MRPVVVLVLLALAVAVIAFVLLRDEPKSPEAQVRASLALAVEAAEKQDLGGLMELVSLRFKSGDLDRNAIKGILFVELRRGSWRRVYLVDTEVEVAAGERQAQVRTGALLTAGGAMESLAEVVPKDAGAYRFAIGMAKEDDDTWRVVSTTYEQVPFNTLIHLP